MTSILLPHKKHKQYWVYGIPNSGVKTGWTKERPTDDYLKLWEDHVKTFDRPELFEGDYRQLFGFNKAAPLFDDALKKYK